MSVILEANDASLTKAAAHAPNKAAAKQQPMHQSSSSCTIAASAHSSLLHGGLLDDFPISLFLKLVHGAETNFCKVEMCYAYRPTLPAQAMRQSSSPGSTASQSSFTLKPLCIQANWMWCAVVHRHFHGYVHDIDH